MGVVVLPCQTAICLSIENIGVFETGRSLSAIGGHRVLLYLLSDCCSFLNEAEKSRCADVYFHWFYKKTIMLCQTVGLQHNDQSF